MDDLLAEFVAETREMLQAIEGEIVVWEADPGDRSRLDSIFRFVHTVKGNCGFFDFPRLEKLSHAAESVLAEVRAGRRTADAALVTTILAVIDRIAQMVDTIEAGGTLADGGDEALIAQLDAEPGDLAMTRPASDGAAESPAIAEARAAARTIRLPVDLLDRVMSGVSDLVLARNDLARRLRDAGAEPAIDGPFERLTATLGEVRDAVSRMRMQRIEQLFNVFPRLVRDLSAELGKQVMLDFDGAAVELDREMIEMVRDPLTHIVRNAIDHGIETPSDRIAAGKREIGMLAMAARQSGNHIVLSVSDDGRGLDAQRIGAKAVANGIIAKAELDAMDRDRVLGLIFEPGLSTAQEVSAISGRGVGMDVVRSNIERIGGSIVVHSEPGEGTCFLLRLPLTLSIIGGLTIGVEGQRLAVPRSNVVEIVHGHSQAIEYAEMGDASLVAFRGERIRYLDLAEVLGLRQTTAKARVLVVVKVADGTQFALGIDRIHDHEELVIKPLPPALAGTRIYSGISLLDDGRPLLLLDPGQIAQLYGLASDKRAQIASAIDTDGRGRNVAARRAMLLTACDGSRRAIPMELVRRIETVSHEAFDIAPGRATVVIDGQILALAGIETGDLPEGRVRLVRLSDGERELAFAVRDIADTIELAGEVTPTPGDPSIEGLAIVDGASVAVIDGHWLFANCFADGTHGRRPTCRLPADDQWSRIMLEPLIRAAGYTVADSEEPVDIAFAMAGEEAAAPQTAHRVIYLRTMRECEGKMADSVYRYDREGVLAALRAGTPP